MQNHKHGILMAVDDSESTNRALDYVAHMLGGRPDVRIHLFHLLKSVPPEYFEHGGAEDPARERRLAEELLERQERWIEEEKNRERPILEHAKSVFLEGGVHAEAIECEAAPSFGGIAVARDCLEAAKDNDCRTIVVGRTSLHWYREVLRRHHCHELVRRAEGFTVWIVE
jgi:hypothetical protein